MCKKSGGNISGSGKQNVFNDLNLIKKEIFGIKRDVNFREQNIKDSLLFKEMSYAYDLADESYARRRKVGAVIYKNDRVISDGYNGTPPKEPNECEYEDGNGNFITKPNVIHAERNALYKLLNDPETNVSVKNASLFVTTATCEHCAEFVAMSGISTIYFTEMYRGVDGLEYLIKRGVSVKHIDMVNKKITNIYESDYDQSVDLKINAIKKVRDFFNEYYDGKYHSLKYDVIN